MLMLVTRLCLGRLVTWQHVDSDSSCHVSGRSSHISTYCFSMMRLISFGGTELKPGSTSRSLPALSAPFDVVWIGSGQRGSPVKADVYVPLPPARVNRGRAENRPAGSERERGSPADRYHQSTVPVSAHI